MPTEDHEPPYDVVVFDCDSTLCSIEGIEELTSRLPLDGQRRVAELTALAMDGHVPLEEVYGRRLDLIRPSRADVDAVGALYVESLLPGAEDTLHALRYLGKELAIVSGGLAPPVEAVGRYLGIDPDRVWAVGMEFDADGQYAGFDADSPLARMGGKPEVVGEAFGGSAIALVGDGATDLEAKSVCRRIVAFTPVAERPDVVAGAGRVCRVADFAALLPHLCTDAELDRLASSGSQRFVRLVDRARRPRLWIPGPTQVRIELLETLAEPMVGHRTDEVRELLADLDLHLRTLFGLEGAPLHSVAVHSCTATALMEMSLRALPRRAGASPRVLALVNGSFSERYAEIAESVGCTVTRIVSPVGAGADLGAAQALLAEGAAFEGITVCLSETSTGALTEATEVAAALAGRGAAMLLVDAVTYLAAAPVDAALHGFDFVFAGTQKALALPPGLGIYAVSHRMLAASTEASADAPDDTGVGGPGRGFFLDLVRITGAHSRQNPPMTPTIPLLRALLVQLQTIASGHLEERLIGEAAKGRSGWELRFARHGLLRAISSEWLSQHGLPRPGSQQHVGASMTVTCVGVGGRPVPQVLAAMREAGFEIAAGYGTLKASHVRIGHMGDHSVQEFRALLAALSGILQAPSP